MRVVAVSLFLWVALPLVGQRAHAAVELEGDQRFRFESLNNNFRAGSSRSDDLLLSRTQIRITADAGKNHDFLVEMTDSRQWLADRETRLNSGMVNTLELTQIRWRWQGPGARVDVGKMAVEDSSRRLVARNQFRNSTNTFLGVDVELQTDESHWRGFLLLPSDANQSRGELLDNRRRSDRFHRERWFAGLSWRGQLAGFESEFGGYHLNEKDHPDRPGRNRHLNSVSAMFEGEHTGTDWRFKSHTVLQWGQRRDTAENSDRNDLEVRAWFQHLSWSRAFNHAWVSRFSLNLDYASGDRSAGDQDSESFDSLFGVTRFEWGPGSLYGALNRTNVVSPSLRLEFKRNSLSGYLAYRPAWVAQTSDMWGRSGITAENGRFIGHQLDFRVRLQQGVQVQWEAGSAYLLRGSMPRTSGVGRERDNPTYGYVQVQFSF